MRFRKVSSSANIKLSKTQLHKIGKAQWFLGRLIRPLIKYGLPLMKHVLKPLAKNILIPLGLTAAATTDAAIQKKILGSGMISLIVSNEEMSDMKIVKYLENADLLGSLLTGKVAMRAGEGTEALEQVRIFNVTSSFN